MITTLVLISDAQQFYMITSNTYIRDTIVKSQMSTFNDAQLTYAIWSSENDEIWSGRIYDFNTIVAENTGFIGYNSQVTYHPLNQDDMLTNYAYLVYYDGTTLYLKSSNDFGTSWKNITQYQVDNVSAYILTSSKINVATLTPTMLCYTSSGFTYCSYIVGGEISTLIQITDLQGCVDLDVSFYRAQTNIYTWYATAWCSGSINKLLYLDINVDMDMISSTIITTHSNYGTFFGVHYNNDVLLIADNQGIYQSNDDGVSFERIVNTNIVSVDIDYIFGDWIIVYSDGYYVYLLYKNTINEKISSGAPQYINIVNTGISNIGLFLKEDYGTSLSYLQFTGNLGESSAPLDYPGHVFTCDYFSCSPYNDHSTITKDTYVYKEVDIKDYQSLTLEGCTLDISRSMVMTRKSILKLNNSVINISDKFVAEGYLDIKSNFPSTINYGSKQYSFLDISSDTCYDYNTEASLIYIVPRDCGVDEIPPPSHIDIKDGVICIDSECNPIEPIISANIILAGSLTIKNNLKMSGSNITIRGDLIIEKDVVITLDNTDTITIEGTFHINGTLVVVQDELIEEDQVIFQFDKSNEVVFTETTLPGCNSIEYTKTHIIMLFDRCDESVTENGFVDNTLYLGIMISVVVIIVLVVVILVVKFNRVIFPFRHIDK